MTLLQLQYFETLARVLHYTRAAEELHIAQPSLSYSIGELEKELGVKLFEKGNRKIHLTEYGERFLPYVQKALLVMDEGTNELKRMSGTAPLMVASRILPLDLLDADSKDHRRDLQGPGK